MSPVESPTRGVSTDQENDKDLFHTELYVATINFIFISTAEE